MNQKSEIDLLLIGKTGNGKSAVGNSILDRRVFESSGATTSVAKTIDYEVSEVNGRVIKVVDTPGVCDTNSDKKAGDKLVMDALESAIATNPKGCHAMLLVVKYGGRFSGEEQAGIKYLKTLFGESFVKDYGILVVTGGDTYEFDNQRHGIPFEKWCRQQTGAFRELYEECDQRAVLFNNISADKSVKANQARQLIALIDQLKSRGKRHTNQAFERARESRAKIFVKSNTLLVKDETIREFSLILQKLRQIQESEEPCRELGNAETLLIRVETLSDNIPG